LTVTQQSGSGSDGIPASAFLRPLDSGVFVSCGSTAAEAGFKGKVRQASGIGVLQDFAVVRIGVAAKLLPTSRN
jgi:hypothetical protein